MPQGETLETRRYNTTSNQAPASPEVRVYQAVQETESITQRAAAERLEELRQLQEQAANTEAQELAIAPETPVRSDTPEELAMDAEELSQRIVGLGVNLSHYRYNAQIGAESQN